MLGISGKVGLPRHAIVGGIGDIGDGRLGIAVHAVTLVIADSHHVWFGRSEGSELIVELFIEQFVLFNRLRFVGFQSVGAVSKETVDGLFQKVIGICEITNVDYRSAMLLQGAESPRGPSVQCGACVTH